MVSKNNKKRKERKRQRAESEKKEDQLEGPLGCGKTFLVKDAAKKLGLPLNVMQMGDMIDSKTLFGSYHCTEVAGQFFWKPSKFTEWLLTPGVILLEDIDTSNADVISKIVDISVSRSTSVKPNEYLPFHPDAIIIATISGKGKKNVVLDGIPAKIHVDALTDEELKRLASKAYPRVAHLAKTLINVFRSIESVPGSGNSRSLTSSDFLRACARLARLVDVSDNQKMFAELVDVWCLADPNERSRTLCKLIADSLSVSPDQVHFHTTVRQPEVSHDEKSVVIGRATLPRAISIMKPSRHRLGHTRDACQLMERIAVGVRSKEAILLVGETGVGKTSVVQAVADLVGVTLSVVNLTPTSDSDQLIQGYRPTTIGAMMEPFTTLFMKVFGEHFTLDKNQKFVDNIEKCLSSGRFGDYLSIVEGTAKKALANTKTRKDERWAELLVRAKKIRGGLEKGAAPFSLQKGAVLEAAENGHWLLVDEINLAQPECLDAIVNALSAPSTHKDFRLFACMNPATDAGKRRLPTGVRTRFTEFYVSETSDPHQLALIVTAYLPTMKQAAVDNLVKFYMSAKQMYPSSYSLRTLCRTLLFTADNMFGSFDSSLYEAVCMAFLTNLELEEKSVMKKKINAAFPLTGGPLFPTPTNASEYIKVQGYWIERGTLLPDQDKKYVVTPTVKQNLAEIARIVCSGRFPVLLEGETSAGKTSIVCHIAKVTGNEVVRINNHEHTDIQEYMGSYVADSGGRLVFREGALVQAVRKGKWVILDELNLASTDVIEALNRLLDDNRELFVPELNETIKAHRRFRIFATQNPAGSYSGRKKLSRALISRFVVLKFHHLPLNELADMVCTRCGVAPSAANKMIEVLSELRIRRSLSSLFSSRDGLMTLRDVFRWAKRLATDETTDDWLQILVNHGYFLLAGRCRNEKDEQTVVETLEKVLKRTVDKKTLFDVKSPYMPKEAETARVVLTTGMRRMLVLTEQAWIRNEAVLMVGETGGGKTSLAEVVGRGKLRSINCHERTETADLLGRLRPKQNGGFEWSDGVVISAMRDGAPLLIDEISLAEDSVLERLNPLFEEDRTLLLSDAGVDVQVVHSADGFKLIATMNPGGDYGKKELSKALRNRFTEVWTSSDYTEDELIAIFDQRLERVEATKSETLLRPTKTAIIIVKWISAFFGKYGHVYRHFPSVRDVVSCAELYSSAITAKISMLDAIRDAIFAVFLDALSGKAATMAIDANAIQKEAIEMLNATVLEVRGIGYAKIYNPDFEFLNVRQMASGLQIGHLKIGFGSKAPVVPRGFSLTAPTCIENIYRIARGLLINKPILLEGAPGCGKSSTVMALASLTGNPITRLNLSDQTDLSDLFGSDVPVLTDDGGITFRWEDGPILKAIKQGEWILLDEMNLASQSVLEGLNACFDHRKILYIAELNRTFEIPSTSNCRFFACQNPKVQGGNRRALPKSFINRFTSIYTNDLTSEDIALVLAEVPGALQFSEATRAKFVNVNKKCAELADSGQFSYGPHSFNLRDLLRWFELFVKWTSLDAKEHPSDALDAFEVLYVSRMRTQENRDEMREIFNSVFREEGEKMAPAVLTVNKDCIRIGKTQLPRTTPHLTTTNSLLSSQMQTLSKVATCIEMNYLTLIIGPRNCGKRSIIENLAQLTGKKLNSISLNADTDAQELIGSYEQFVDETILDKTRTAILALERIEKAMSEAQKKKLEEAADLIQLEVVMEMVLSEVTDADTVTECRRIIEEAHGSAMRFEWVDSTFVDTYLNGDWLLIEDVNLCSAAVLDRLNSCLEASGKLVISERQNSYEPLSPHDNFRVILTMDPKSGEISRAMRNRSVEIFMDTGDYWYLNPNDVNAVVGRHHDGLPMEIAEKISSLDVDQQLKLAILTESGELSISTTCNILGLGDVYDVTDGTDIVQLPPTITNIDIELDEWFVLNWKRAYEEMSCSKVEAILLTFLSSSSKGWASIVNVFGNSLAEPFVKILEKIDIKAWKNGHPVDSKFNRGLNVWSDDDACEKYNITVLCEWAYQILARIPSHPDCADKLSRTMTKYEMATSPLSFNGLDKIAKFIDLIIQDFSRTGVFASSGYLFNDIIHIILFVSAARRKLTTRTGKASMYLVFMSWVDSFTKIEGRNEYSKKTEAAKEEIMKCWTSNEQQKFLDGYLDNWKYNRPVTAFSNEQQAERFVQRLEEILSKRAAKEVFDVPMEDEDDENDEEKVQQLPVSPVDTAIKLADNLENVHKFLSKGVIDENESIFHNVLPMNAWNWSGEESSRYFQRAALLSTTMVNNETVDPSDIESTSTSISRMPFVRTHSFCASTFFSAIHFDPSLSTLRVGHLQDFALHKLAIKLWKSAVNVETFNQEMEKAVTSIFKGLKGWRGEESENTSGWKTSIVTKFDMVKRMMESSVPPEDTLDPVIYEEERVTLLHAKKRMIDNQLDLLSTWRRLVSSQDITADRLSRHNVIEELRTMSHDIELDLLDTDEINPENQVHRQPASMYHKLCAELKSFRTVTLDTVQLLLEKTSDQSLSITRIQSYLMSSANFRITLLRTFTSFADVTSPFIAACLLAEVAFKEWLDQLTRSQRETDLRMTTAFPIILRTMPTVDGLKCDAATSWAIRDASPMPLRLKAAVMADRLANGEEGYEAQFDLQWTRSQWKKWYERNVAKAEEKDFEYRSKTEEEKDELDMLSFFSLEAADKEVLCDSDMSLLLESTESNKKSILGEAELKAVKTRRLMADAWIRNVITNVGKMPQHVDDQLFSIHGDQQLLETIQKGVDSGESGIVDVYRQASLPECRRVAGMLEKLAEATKRIQERWPEVASLKNILRVIDEFYNVSTSTPHVKLTNQIEKLLEECDQWEKIADRANSLREQLADIRHLLVDWKKMEVRCWTNLLERTENEGKQRAQLVAFPLFDALFTADTKESTSALVAMSCEWMHNATLLDFSTRVASIDCLSIWAQRLQKPLLAAQLKSASAHFGQFIPPIDARLKAARDPTVNHLKEYLQIVKYKDVNLLNIQVSSQKAHAQLFKFVRRFKDAVGVQVDEDFGNLLPIEEWKCVLKERIAEKEADDKLVQRAQKLSKKITTSALALSDHTVFRDLTEQTKSADDSIRTMINYVGEDEEKEKLQGYERNKRQREVAMMLKEAQSVGWNARRAVALKAENINQLSITHVLQGEVEKHVRACSSGRNLVIQKSNKVDQQVGISTRKHILGMIEYGMYYELLLQKKLFSWKEWSDSYTKLITSLKTLEENKKAGWNIIQKEVHERRSAVESALKYIEALIVLMKGKVDAIPDPETGFSEANDHFHPLAQLTKTDQEAKKLVEQVQTLIGLFESMKAAQKNLGTGPVFAKKAFVLWSEQMTAYAKKLQEDVAHLDKYLHIEARSVGAELETIKEYVQNDVYHIIDLPTQECETIKIQLLVQSLYKTIVDDPETKEKNATVKEDVKPLDKVTLLVNALESTINNDTSYSYLKNVLKQTTNPSCFFNGVDVAIQLAEQAVSTVNTCLQQLTDTLAYFCILYRSLVSLAVQLFEKGYVNTIPKAEKQESGDGQTEESGEGGGMGEGGTASDAKDVTDEMEETGQIEGLQDDTPADSEEHESKNSNEKPIDMEDDFAEDLQDIDKNEPGDQQNDDDESDQEEPEAEDQMGEVDEEDEKQLDPKLWDDEEEEEDDKKNDQKDIDQENDGADDKTNDMVAKDDAKPGDEQEADKGDDKADEEEQDEVENMDERDQEDDGKEDATKEAQKEDGIDNIEDDAEQMDEDKGIDGEDDETDPEDNDGEPEDEDMKSASDVEGEEKEAEDDPVEQAQIDEADDKNDQNDDKMEQGQGGEKRENEESDRQEGGMNEDDQEEDDEKEKDEQKGEGKKKSDPRGEDGKGEEAREEEEKEDDKEENEEDQKHDETRKRKLAEEDGVVEEEAEQGEGEENETGQQMEDAPTSDRQMRGSGTLDEAKQTNQKREEKKEEEKSKNKKRKLNEGVVDDGGAEGGEVEDANAKEEKEATIHLAAPEELADTMNKGLTIGEEVEEPTTTVSQKADPDEKSAQQRWQAMARDVGYMASELAENLRLILEPQRANKMQGDYRSGKRLNMRRLIPYIASEYRKDRIWMRRTKHAQREYQIMIAVDDSGSMDENGIHEVTCQSVCVVEEALRRCDAGSVSVVSFGSEVTTIVPFGDSSASTSVDIIKKLTFAQKSTDLLQMLRHSRAKLEEVRTGSSEQMLIIISDGRGALAQGADKVKALYSQLQNVTVLFVILDSGPKSINTLTVASFQNNAVVLKPYLSIFPFPYYAIINSIQQLPNVIAESIRQWFEVTSHN